MIDWKTITSDADIKNIVSTSHDGPILILKHSTSCSISTIAKMRLEDDWKNDLPLRPYLVKVIENRRESLKIAELFEIHHESPQVLLVSNGKCFYDVSHLDISINEVIDGLAELA